MLVLWGAAPAVTSAQTIAMPAPVEIKLEDENDVDVASGIVHFSVTDVSIGGLGHSTRSGHGYYINGFDRRLRYEDSFHGGLRVDYPEPHGGAWDYRTSFSVAVGGRSERFFINSDGSLEATNGGTLTLGSGTPLTFVCNADSSVWTYTAGDGTVALIDRRFGAGATGACGAVTRITYPDGTIVRINYRLEPSGFTRLQSVTRNDGFQLKYNYALNGAAPSGVSNDFWIPHGVTGINNAYQACDPLADTCGLTGAWPQSNYVWSNSDTVFSITDQAGATTRFTMDRHHRVIAVKPAGSSIDTIIYEYCSRGDYMDPIGGAWYYETAEEATHACILFVADQAPGVMVPVSRIEDRVGRVTRDGRIWNYSFPFGTYGPYVARYSSIGPQGEAFALRSLLGTGALILYASPYGTANYENTARNRMTSAQGRGGPPETYTYDARGNVLSDAITSAGYDAVCANIRTCNKPNWSRDVAGNQTDYTYDPVHGGVTSITAPAVNGVRPQTRYSYVQRFAWFRNGAGVMTRSSEPIWKLASERACRISAASGSGCATAGDEVVTAYDYGPDSGPNNLLLRGRVVTADGVSLRTCYSYDIYGNRISETAPRANLGACP